MTGKTRDAGRTKQNILRAAQQIFSTRSYAEAGLRDIAAVANVNASLVSRYFGSKEKLFEAALDDALDPSILTDVDRCEFGKVVTERLLSPQHMRANPLALLVFASSHSGAREVALHLLNERIIDPLAEWMGPPDSKDRAARFMAFTAGFFTYRFLLPLSTFTGEVSPQTRKWLADGLQTLVDNI